MFEKAKQATLERRVSAGAVFLDNMLTRAGWLPHVNAETLALQSGNSCMIGQLFPAGSHSYTNNFTEFVKSNHMSDSRAISLGFYLPKVALPWRPNRAYYADLTGAWKRKMAALKAEAELGTPSPIVVGMPAKRSRKQ